MWEQIKRNKRNSILIILLILLLIPILGYCIGLLIFYYFLYFGFKLHFIPILSVVVTSCLFLYVSIYYRNNLSPILKIFNSYKITKTNHYVLNNIVEEMTIASGLSKTPKVYIIDCSVPNAFAAGFKPSKSTVIVTTGLLTELNREELQSVIAHEIAHIANRDTMYMMFAGYILSTVSIIAEAMKINPNKEERTKKVDYILLHPIVRILIWSVCKIFAEAIYPFFKFSLSREREYLADACAVQYTRNPQGLASALYKIANYKGVRHFEADKLTSAMCIINPKEITKNSNLFSTHPPTEQRIRILMTMSGVNYEAYNRAYIDVLKKEKNLERTIQSTKNYVKANIKKSKKFLRYIVNSIFLIEDSIQNNSIEENINTIPPYLPQYFNELPKESNDYETDKAFRKRQAYDIVWRGNNYIFKECSCGTKLKFPNVYTGEEIKCPHCKKIIRVEETDHNNE